MEKTTMTVEKFAEMHNLSRMNAYSLLTGLVAAGYVSVKDAPKVPGKRGRRKKLYTVETPTLNLIELFDAVIP